MTAGGWLFMLSSVGFVLVLTAYCFVKVLAKKSSDVPDLPPTP